MSDVLIGQTLSATLGEIEREAFSSIGPLRLSSQ